MELELELELLVVMLVEMLVALQLMLLPEQLQQMFLAIAIIQMVDTLELAASILQQNAIFHFTAGR